ncbi:uncharacterized protein LOC119324224 [Triticum dicoccoides]|uniref:uncharacterized protein LOC119324224 n=1 Tax=Triticum dicoccoides TaxID=85692 RepID=UPI001891795E|nr:uncharacterized protein LOC119324224 [Triticum dicoccoides]XP_044411622.1 uncharacterized protein LOC123136326 [Triticum aestivum]
MHGELRECRVKAIAREARWLLPPAGSGRRSTGPGPSGVAVERCWCRRRRKRSCGSPLFWRHEPRGALPRFWPVNQLAAIHGSKRPSSSMHAHDSWRSSSKGRLRDYAMSNYFRANGIRKLLFL